MSITAQRVFRKLQKVAGFSGRSTDLEYWEDRVREHGARSVLNINHTADEVAQVTARQKGVLLPLLRSSLNGTERTALDFGCGPGRFTADIGAAVGQVVAADAIRAFRRLVPEGVPFVPISNGKLPLPSHSVDVIWCCLVLGCISDDKISLTVAEFMRVLSPGGLIFLAENTADKPNHAHFTFRTAEQYARMFPGVSMRKIGEYEDVGEPISVFAGRHL